MGAHVVIHFLRRCDAVMRAWFHVMRALLRTLRAEAEAADTGP